jgi:hypothetical protein
MTQILLISRSCAATRLSCVLYHCRHGAHAQRASVPPGNAVLQLRMRARALTWSPVVTCGRILQEFLGIRRREQEHAAERVHEDRLAAAAVDGAMDKKSVRPGHHRLRLVQDLWGETRILEKRGATSIFLPLQTSSRTDRRSSRYTPEASRLRRHTAAAALGLPQVARIRERYRYRSRWLASASDDKNPITVRSARTMSASPKHRPRRRSSR